MHDITCVTLQAADELEKLDQPEALDALEARRSTLRSSGTTANSMNQSEGFFVRLLIYVLRHSPHPPSLSLRLVCTPIPGQQPVACQCRWYCRCYRSYKWGRPKSRAAPQWQGGKRTCQRHRGAAESYPGGRCNSPRGCCARGCTLNFRPEPKLTSLMLTEHLLQLPLISDRARPAAVKQFTHGLFTNIY